jgi:hypothetical protein
VQHAAIGGKHLQDIIGHATRMRIERESIRMGEDDRRSGHAQRVSHCVGAHMGKIDEHAEAVHLSHDAPAQFGQSVMQGAIGRGVCPVDVVPVGKRHIARAEFVEDAQRARRIFNHVAAFDAHQIRDFAGIVNPLDIVGSAGLLEIRLAVDQS